MNNIFKTVWCDAKGMYVVSSEFGKGCFKSKSSSGLMKKKPISLALKSVTAFLIIAIPAFNTSAANVQPTSNNIDATHSALNGELSIAGGSVNSSWATDNQNMQNAGSGRDYGIALGALSKGFWASVAVGDSAEGRSLYGTALGPHAKIDDSSDYAVTIGQNSDINKSNNGIALGSKALLSNAENSVVIGANASVNGAKGAVAIGSDSIAENDNTVSFGSSSLKRKLINLDTGTLSNNSSDAVNGSQLYATNEAVAKNSTDIASNTSSITSLSNNIASGKSGLIQLSDDGQSLVFADIASSATRFNAGNRVISGVNAGKLSADSDEAVNGSQLYATNTKVDKNTSDISSMSDAISKGKTGIVQLSDDGTSMVISDAAQGADTLNLGDRTISGVKAGELSETSTEAVNGSQLHATNQQVSQNTNSIKQLTNDVKSGKTGVAQVNGNKIVFDDKGQGTTTIDAGNRDITNIKKGEVSKTSSSAVNGSQLYDTNMKVENNTAEIAVNKNDIKTNKSDIAVHSHQIANLESSFSEMNGAFKNLTKEVDKNKKRADAGIAGAMAMSAIPYVSSQDVSFGMAVSGYQQQGALAAGMTFRTSDNSAIRLNTSWDSQHGSGVAAGFAVGW